MKKYTFLLLLQYGLGTAIAQDYVITWTNDTITCSMPSKPGKIGLRPAGKYQNGYEKVTAVFANDSIRVINAGEIKGYYRAEHGKWYLCDGHFEARKVDPAHLRSFNRTRRDQDNPWFFMNVLVTGKHASLFRIYVVLNKLPAPVYFLVKNDSVNSSKETIVWRRKEMYELLGDADIKEEMNAIRKNHPKLEYAALVKHYNRLKEERSSKNR